MAAAAAQILVDIVYSFGHCLSCFPSSPTLRVNGRSFKILQLLGEGGFSYVYLVQDTATGDLFALKKIRCPFGAESVRQAMREVDAYRLFRHVPGIISAVDHAVASERGGGNTTTTAVSDPTATDDSSKTVYVLLPYYRRGNLQDLINANLVGHARFPERHLMALFLGVCRALRGMHRYRAPPARLMDMGHEADARVYDDDDDDDDDDDGDGGAGNHDGTQDGTTTTAVAEGERLLVRSDNQTTQGGKIKAYAHRDIKPGNIMIDNSGSDPILMDLGSVVPSPTPVPTPSVALQVQETAAEHSTMPYRAPELFDVRPGPDARVDTAVDIWSLGCTLFACLVGKSPFEMRSDETGGSLSLCVQGGDWRFPDRPPISQSQSQSKSQSQSQSRSASGAGGNSIQAAKAKAKAGNGPGTAEPANSSSSSSGDMAISEPIRDIVRACLKVEPSERPDINQLITMVENVIQNLPPDEP